MQYSKNMLFTDGDTIQDLEDEELDALFGQLEQFVPPESLVESIMATVAQLPPYSQLLTRPTEEPIHLALNNDFNH